MNDQTALNQIFQYVYNNAITKADAGNIQEALNDVKLLNDQTALNQISQHIYSNAIAKANKGNAQGALADVYWLNDQTKMNQINNHIYNNAIATVDAGNIENAINYINQTGNQNLINNVNQYVYDNAISIANSGRFNDSINYISKVNNPSLVADITNIVKVLKVNGNYRYINKTSKIYGSEVLKFNVFYDNVTNTYINIQENYNYRNNYGNLNFDQILSIYSQLSNKYSEKFKSINELTITDIRNPNDLFWANQNRKSDFRTALTGRGGRITIYKYAYGNKLEYSFIHELGHNLDVKNGIEYGISNSSEWIEAFKSDKKGAVSEYAKQSLNRTKNKYAEDFAESIALSQENSKLFEANYPNRAAIIKKIFPELYRKGE